MSGDTFSIKAIIRAVDQFSPTMKRMAANMDHFGKVAQSVGKGMTASVSAPIAAFGGLTLKTAVDFESAMNRVEAISGETGDSLKAMRDLAKSLGSNTAFSAGQAADAMGFLAQAGWKANKILAGTPAFLDLAAASGTDLADAAGIASKIMGQFEISAGNASRVADVLAAATASANVDMQMIAESMKAAGPIANKYGLSLEDTAAAIGLLGNVGIQGENAGTALKNTMLAMVSPAGDAAKMLKFLGVQTKDAEGNMLPLVDVLAGFGSALEKAGIGEGQKLQAIQTMFGKEGLAGATELLAQAQSGALQKYAESLTNIEGRARSMAQTMMKGAPGAVKNLASAFEGLQLAIARSGLLEWFSQAVKGLTGLIKNLSQTSPELLKLGTIVAGVAAVAGPALWAIGAMASGIAAITTAMAGLKLALLVNPLTGWAVAAAAAVYAIYDNWGNITQWFTEKFDAIRSAFSDGLLNGMLEAWTQFNPITVMLEAFDGLVSYLTGFDLSGYLLKQVQAVTSGLPDWARDLIGTGGGAAPVQDRKQPSALIDHARNASIINGGQPRPRDVRAALDVNFNNVPQGTRVEYKSPWNDMDLGVGLGYAFTRPK